MSTLDDPVRAALLGPHAHLARRHGTALAYPADVSPFAAPPGDATGWADLAVLIGDGEVVLPHLHVDPPRGWTVFATIPGVQMVASNLDTDLDAAADPAAVRLGPADVPAMAALVAATRPGPFRERTIALGTYLGIRDGDRLVAMAGERIHPPGFTEISAVCTDPAYRGRGLAARLVLAIVAGIRARGEAPFLHAAADNVAAIRLYERLGFRHRAGTPFVAVRAAAGTVAPDPAGQLQRTP
ncbi:GNAT family N-acetyltransferase [Pseudonocardia sp.]|uniref:GNAT family N-acetyltransferase n=1 Tax=Pseudonocardia sp. TaxID=60912 RepID=UPI003D1271B5